jgi:hypothetical protein
MESTSGAPKLAAGAASARAVETPAAELAATAAVIRTALRFNPPPLAVDSMSLFELLIISMVQPRIDDGLVIVAGPAPASPHAWAKCRMGVVEVLDRQVRGT